MYGDKEGETPLEDISGLKVRIPHIKRSQLDALEAKNIQKAALKYLTGKKAYSFDCGFFYRLHKDMFGDVWRWAGECRTTQTNLGSPPQLIRQDLIVLEQDLKYWPKDLESGVRLHHRAVQTHPFPNGNGRWARFLSDLWLRQNLKMMPRWPVSLNNTSDIRGKYIAALKRADAMDYEPLLNLYKQYAVQVSF